jgi:DNA-binding CsgD family transcriptional regulator/PAS domain-containing protein
LSAAVETAPPIDCVAAFSDAVGLIYESRLDPARVSEASRAIERLLDADEIAVLPASPGADAHFHRRANGRLLCLDIPGPSGARLIVRRRLDRPPFCDRELQLLSLLRPHLQRAEWLASFIPHGLLGRLACDTFVSLMNQGLIVCDVDGVIHWCNPVAGAILDVSQGLARSDGRLRADRAFETTNLMELLRRAAKGELGTMLIGRGQEKHSLGIAVAPLHSRQYDSSRPMLLVALKEVEREINVLAGRLGELFGLTGAEERLAVLLLNGHTLQSAAAASRKTLATVKTQLHGLLKKTGARGQADLMNTLLSLPSLI